MRLKHRATLNRLYLITKKALELKPDFAEALVSMGSVYIELGRLKEATSSFKKALQFKQNFADRCHGLCCR